MAKHNEVEFLIPKDVQEKINDRQCKVIGGVICKALDGEPLLWLAPNATLSEQVLKGSKIVQATTSILRLIPNGMNLKMLTMAFADFASLLSVFSRKHERVQKILAKIDQTQFASVESGLRLAVDAREISNHQSAIVQITTARQSLMQGMSYFAKELESAQNDNISATDLLDLIGLIVVAQTAVARTYWWTGDYLLAKNHILRLALILVDFRLFFLQQSKDKLASQKKGFSLLSKRLVSAEKNTWGTIALGVLLAVPATSEIASRYLLYDAHPELFNEGKIEAESHDFEKLLQQKKEQIQKLEQKLWDIGTQHFVFSQEFREYENSVLSKILDSPEISMLKSMEEFINAYLIEIQYFQQHKLNPNDELTKILPIASIKFE